MVKLKKPFNKFPYIAFLGLAVWLGETAFFGFNSTPENNIEATLDILSFILVAWGVIGDLSRNVQIHKIYQGDVFNSKNFRYYDKRENGKNAVNVTTTTEDKK